MVKAAGLKRSSERHGANILGGLGAILGSVVLLAGCQKADTGDEGASSRPQTATPGSAPEAQPQYGQTGTATSSRVLTNGQLGLSTREAQAPGGNETQVLPTSDQALSQRVLVALSTGTTGTSGTYSSQNLLPITVSASNGVVTLQGAVGTEEAKQDFEKRTKDMDGVRGVSNQLKVVPGAPDRAGLPAGHAINERHP